MKNYIQVFIFIFLMCGNGFVFAQSTDQLGKDANTAYSLKKYPEAAKLYEQIIAKGFESASLYYNLGNAYYKMDSIPQAILYYEKALKLDPTADDVQFNLGLANSKIVDKIEPIPQIFYKQWIAVARHSMSVTSFAIWAIALFAFSFLLFGLFLLSKRLFVRKLTFWFSVGSVVVALAFLLFAQKNYATFKNPDEGILMTAVVNVKSSPDTSSTLLFVLHKGSKVSILDTVGNWFQIRIANGSEGWIEVSDVRKI